MGPMTVGRARRGMDVVFGLGLGLGVMPRVAVAQIDAGHGRAAPASAASVSRAPEQARPVAPPTHARSAEVRGDDGQVARWASTDPGGTHVTPQMPLQVHQSVQILWHSTWYEGSVVAVNANGTVRIHYRGYGAGSDEDVDRANLRVGGTIAAADVQPPTGPPAGETVVWSPNDPGGAPVSSLAQIAPGRPVQIRWNSSWYQGRVAHITPDGHVIIHYDGYAATSDAQVALGDLRLGGRIVPEQSHSTDHDPGGQHVSPRTPLAPGQPVQIRWQGSWYTGRVVSLGSRGNVLIHYDGYGASSDERVSRSRLRIGGTIP